MIYPIYGIVGSPSTTVVNYTSIGMTTTYSSASTSSTLYRIAVPISMTISNFYIKMVTAPGGVATRNFTIMKNGVATALSVTISGSNTTGVDTTNVVSLVAGDDLEIRFTPSGTPAATNSVTWSLVGDSAGQVILNSASNTTTSLEYMSAFGGNGSAATTESYLTIPMPCAGTFSNLNVGTSVAPGGATSKVFTLRKGGSNTVLTATVSGSNTTASNVVNTVSFAAGDLVSVAVTVSGVPTASVSRFSMVFTPTVSGNSVIGHSSSGLTPSNTAVNYNIIGGHTSNWFSGATGQESALGNWVIKNMYAKTLVLSGSGRSYVARLRVNSTDSALVVTMANTTSILNTVADVVISQGDIIGLSSTPSGTPTASRFNVGFLVNAPPTPVNTTNFFQLF